MKSRFSVLAILAVFALAVASFWPREGKPFPLRLGLDLQGGAELVYEIDNVAAEARAKAVHDAKPVVEDRIARGASADTKLAAFEVRTDGERLVVTLPGIDPARLAAVKRTIEEQGTLEFRLAITPTDRKRDDDAIYEEEAARRVRGEPPLAACRWYRVFGQEREEWVLVEDEPQPARDRPLTGTYLEPSGVFADFDPETQGKGYLIHFRWNAEGARMFSAMTAANAATTPESHDGRRLAIILNEARDEKGNILTRPDGSAYGILYSDPAIRSEIGESGIIQGGGDGFSKDEANRLVTVLRSGSLPGRPRLVDETSIGPLLGDDTIRNGVMASMAGLLFVFVFISVYYMACGWVTVLALLMNAALVLAAMSLFGQTLTLPGIAGVILTVGMAVDANVLIFERIREETAAGKGVGTALEQGFSRAFSAIWDSHVTTVITSILLWKFGSGPVEGFGITLTYGLVFSLFTSVVVTKAFLRAAVGAGILTRFRMLQFVPPTGIPFSRYFRAGVVLSAVVILGGLYLIGKRGAGYLGIDFTGGTHVRVRLAEPQETEAFRGRVQDLRRARGYERTDPLVVPYGERAGGGFYEFGITTQRAEGEDEKKALAGWVDAIREEFAAVLAPQPFPEDGERIVPRRMHCTVLFTPGTTAAGVGAALAGAYPSATVEPVSATEHAVAFRIASNTGTPQDVVKTLRSGPLKGAFLSDRLYPAGGAGGRYRFAAKFRDPVSPDDLSKKLVEKGYADPKVTAAADPDGGRRVVVETAVDDIRALENDLSSLYAMGEILADSGSDPAGREQAMNLLLPLSEPKINERLAAIHTGLKLVKTEPAGPVTRVVVYAADDALDAIARAKKAARPDMKAILAESFRKEISDPFPSVTVRGAAVAAQTKQKAVLASLWSLAAIIVYIGIRFDFRSGVAAVIALVHDTLVALGALAAAGYAMDLEVVGAVLTIIGYSINDTIVIYDRLRENLKLKGKGNLVEVMDLTLNQTLSRTILTTGLTMLSAIAILVWGGDEVRPFAFTLVVGMISGTYSTIYIACPLLARWQASETGKKGKK